MDKPLRCPYCGAECPDQDEWYESGAWGEIQKFCSKLCADRWTMERVRSEMKAVAEKGGQLAGEAEQLVRDAEDILRRKIN